MKLYPGALLLLGACGFHSPASDPVGDDQPVVDADVDVDVEVDSGGGGGGGSDGSIDVPRDLPHVPSTAETGGMGTWTLSGTVTISTSGATIVTSQGLPGGVLASIVAQQGSGPEIAVIRAGTVNVTAGANVVVTGTRPLVIIANTITVDGTIDVGAALITPGAGGGAPGSTAAMNGVHTGTYGDSGGGGGAFTQTSGAGGSANTTCGTLASGGITGTAYGTAALDVLEGGRGGGGGSKGSCTTASGGAGGGAIQLSAFVTLTIGSTGRVLASGGGGKGGVFCNNDDAGAGGGGGSGGAIYLDAPKIQLDGRLAANGGAGGGGGCGPGGSGGDGQNGKEMTPAVAGGPGGSCGTRGGDGAAGVSPGQFGTANGCDGNGGGGGGAVGRVVLHHSAAMVISGGGSSVPVAADRTF